MVAVVNAAVALPVRGARGTGTGTVSFINGRRKEGVGLANHQAERLRDSTMAREKFGIVRDARRIVCARVRVLPQYFSPGGVQSVWSSFDRRGSINLVPRWIVDLTRVSEIWRPLGASVIGSTMGAPDGMFSLAAHVIVTALRVGGGRAP